MRTYRTAYKVRAMERLSVDSDSVDAVLRAAEANESKPGGVYVLFCGGVRQDTGESWCPDCVKAEPVVEKVVAAQRSGVFIHCSVGDRDSWKDPQNAYRKHPKLLLKGVPTLLQWNSAKRLVEDDCANEELVIMLFEEE